jgi:hypothetical protein
VYHKRAQEALCGICCGFVWIVVVSVSGSFNTSKLTLNKLTLGCLDRGVSLHLKYFFQSFEDPGVGFGLKVCSSPRVADGGLLGEEIIAISVHLPLHDGILGAGEGGRRCWG